MADKKPVEYKKYGLNMMGQFRKRSKKAQALFIGRAIQQLTDKLKQHEEEKHLRMDTLGFYVHEIPALTEEAVEIPGWIIVVVTCDVLSSDEYTEEDRKRDEERLRKAREAKAEEEKQYGEKAMKELERQMNPPKVEDRIQ